MLKYIDLCVATNKGKMAKDGLHQFRLTVKKQKRNINNNYFIIYKLKL
jgi:hypothetical protein